MSDKAGLTKRKDDKKDTKPTTTTNTTKPIVDDASKETPKYTVADFVNHEANKAVVRKFAITTFLMLTIPTILFWILNENLPIWTDGFVDEIAAPTYAGLASVFSLTSIIVIYIILAFYE
eukprot:TRINITY_DN17921_c0_g1_i1.p2 TRINITY_DN17921_c0_g1~~TRINITY_DN17921_c0_g1_i1.p2  ORF type:complete len:135 (-),score=60.45 TRINITY_DN17921_c0_g1_i1:26-385(-)